MLTTRPGKRDESLSSDDLMFDILDEGEPIGSLVFNKNVLEASIALDGERYRVARVSEPHEGSVGQEKFFTTTLTMKLPAEFDAAFRSSC
jgi:hypothetical protein